MAANTPIDDEGFMRLSDVLSVFPVSKSTWWSGVKTGRFPPSVKLSPGVTAWRRRDIRELLDRYQPEKEVA